MFMVTPDLARAVHAERRRRLEAAAEARRLRRELAPVRRPQDARVARLVESWMEPDARTARLLARAADEITVRAGTTLAPGRFSYIGIDADHADLLVTTGRPAVTVESDATVLVVRTADLGEIASTVPRLAAALAPPATRDAPPVALPRPAAVTPFRLSFLWR